MPQTFLIFDFGSNEEAAQQARHSVERWRQGFRLDRKLLLKFDRQEPAEPEASGDEKKQKKAEPAEAAEAHIVLMVRLDFSDHERLSHQRWLERIPGEAAFKDAQAKVIRHTDEDFEKAAAKFDTLP